MKIFRFYSTAKANHESDDVIVNMDNNSIELIHLWYDHVDNQYILNIMISSRKLSEVHIDIKTAKSRISEILKAFGADETEADMIASQSKFVRKSS